MGKDIYDLCITIPFPSEREAQIAHTTLKVDEEPKRSAVEKQLVLDGSQLIMEPDPDEFIYSLPFALQHDTHDGGWLEFHHYLLEALVGSNPPGTGKGEFLTQLTIMFHDVRNTGSVRLCMKRYDGRTKSSPKDKTKKIPEPSEYLCLLRATTNSKKVSTVVHPKDVNKFQQAYCSLLRSNMDGLKKLKKAKPKTKATQ